jgi:membrane-associated phospholipid phosphatase
VKPALVDASDEEKTTQTSTASAHSAHALGIVFSTIYLVVLTIVCIRFSIAPSPEFLVVCFLIYAAYGKWTRRFIRDWFPFITLLLTFEAMRTIADNLSGVVHVGELLSAEMRMFGAVPTLVLQQFYRTPILDYLGAFFYSLHFIVPTAFAFILWKFSPKNYWKYMSAFLLCSYAALITSAVYPTAPPWDAKIGAVRILYQVDHQIGVPVYRTIFDYIQANPYAAFPSLHSAYPWLVSLYAIKIKRTKALPIIVLPIGVWFSAVYLGEHYVVDVLGGIAYATCAFVLAEKLIPHVSLGNAQERLRRLTARLH